MSRVSLPAEDQKIETLLPLNKTTIEERFDSLTSAELNKISRSKDGTPNPSGTKIIQYRGIEIEIIGLIPTLIPTPLSQIPLSQIHPQDIALLRFVYADPDHIKKYAWIEPQSLYWTRRAAIIGDFAAQFKLAQWLETQTLELSRALEFSGQRKYKLIINTSILESESIVAEVLSTVFASDFHRCLASNRKYFWDYSLVGPDLGYKEALFWYDQSSKGGVPEASQRLFDYLDAWAAAGATDAQAELAGKLGLFDITSRKQTVYSLLTAVAEKRPLFPKEAYKLGMCYLHQPSENKDSDEMKRLLEKSTSAGSPPTEEDMAICWLEGYGMPQNRRLGIRLLRELAEQKQATPIGYFKMGVSYINKIKSKKWNLGFTHLQNASAGGLVIAKLQIVRCYSKGRGVELNLWQAAALCKEIVTTQDKINRSIFGNDEKTVASVISKAESYLEIWSLLLSSPPTEN